MIKQRGMQDHCVCVVIRQRVQDHCIFEMIRQMAVSSRRFFTDQAKGVQDCHVNDQTEVVHYHCLFAVIRQGGCMITAFL